MLGEHSIGLRNLKRLSDVIIRVAQSYQSNQFFFVISKLGEVRVMFFLKIGLLGNSLAVAGNMMLVWILSA